MNTLECPCSPAAVCSVQSDGVAARRTMKIDSLRAEQANRRAFVLQTKKSVSAAGWWLTAALVGCVTLVCMLAGWLPLGVSMVGVFLFAAPHNWFEGRYMMTRMPARWGTLWPFFSSGLLGVLLLAGSFALLPWFAGWGDWNEDNWLTALAVWNTALVAWVLLLVEFRSRQKPARDLRWVHPLGCGLIVLAWLSPQAWDLGLIYLHPIMALWFLDREIGKCRPAWRAAYRRTLAVLPVLMIALWWRLWDTPSLPGDDALSWRIAAHAGAGVLEHVSSHLLVATHVFLESLHYGVWLVMIPMVSWKAAPWDIAQVPLARRSIAWRRGLAAFLLAGAAIVMLFWAGFLADYPLTRDIYFTAALVHVLAEVPFMLRLL